MGGIYGVALQAMEGGAPTRLLPACMAAAFMVNPKGAKDASQEHAVDHGGHGKIGHGLETIPLPAGTGDKKKRRTRSPARVQSNQPFRP